jgi:putative toxin-antitoxin system antitoxin component (TIGR02293 family)
MAKSKKYITEDEVPESIVEEAAVHYETMRVVLGGNNLFSVPSFDDMDLIRLSRKGVRKSSLKPLSQYLGITMDKMSTLLHTSHRNIQRKDDNELLDVYKSERVIEITQVISKGLELFGTADNLQQWLHSTILSLGGKKPIDLLDTSFGVRMILKLLGRIEHGVYS